jgi:hypothetical protein
MESSGSAAPATATEAVPEPLEPDVADPPQRETRLAGLQRVLGWTEVPLAFAGVITLTWSLLTFLLPANELDLVVWVSKEAPLFPAPQTDGRGIAFTFEGQPVTSADVWTVRVTNEGKSYIGAQERPWELVLTHPNAQIMRIIDTPTVSSDRVPVSIVQSSAPNEARVRIGVLEHRQTVSFRLLLLNSAKRLHGGLKAATTLAGVPAPLRTHRSPQERLGDRLAPFAFSAFVIIVGWAALKEMRQLGILKRPVAVLKYAALTLGGSAMVAAFTAQFLGWALWRFL